MLKQTIILLLSILSSVSSIASMIKPTFLAEVTPEGAKITAISLEYENNILSGSDLRKVYDVATSLNQKEYLKRNIIRAYVNDKPSKSFESKSGKFVILELDDRDTNANFYSLRTENEQLVGFKTKDANGKIIYIDKVQSNKVPEFYQKELTYLIKQTGILKFSNGIDIAPSDIKTYANRENISIKYIDLFSSHQISLSPLENHLLYRLYSPQKVENKKYPLTLFLHGSGQVGKDNIAQLLSSKGAISTLQYEEGFVVAPQYSSVFDPFDKEGIHWQTDNRHRLIFKMLDEIIANNPHIDTRRIYIVGVSRGAEGGLYLLQKRPELFAAALLMSGREANTIEWIDGNATKASLLALKDKPIWLFHSKEDKVSPVQGSRTNYDLLSKEIGSKFVRYTEFTTQKEGDNGIVNNNAHNSWDAVFNSPEVMNWLLKQ
ncbi:phospholipase [Ursidibacter sp. B-7004-1]